MAYQEIDGQAEERCYGRNCDFALNAYTLKRTRSERAGRGHAPRENFNPLAAQGSADEQYEAPGQEPMED
jgi:hypothetical protein